MGIPEASTEGFPWTPIAVDQAQSAEEFPTYHPFHPGRRDELPERKEGWAVKEGQVCPPWQVWRRGLPAPQSCAGEAHPGPCLCEWNDAGLVAISRSKEDKWLRGSTIPSSAASRSVASGRCGRCGETPSQNQSKPVLTQSYAGILNLNKKNCHVEGHPQQLCCGS